MKKGLTTIAIIALAASAHASDWLGGNASWGSNTNPGWNGTGVPNAQGAVANHGVATTTTTTQDTGSAVTVGTISLTNNSANSWTITNTNGITLDQDGAGAGFATISNTNTNTGTTNALTISGGTITLADDLLITNTGGSTNATGAIQIASIIAGTGNVTLSNVSTALTQNSSLRLQGVNTFTGSVLAQKGTVTINQNTVFGNAANIVTLGQSGQGSASILMTAGVNVANPIVVAAGSGGTLTLGGINTGANTYSGTLTLNGDVTINSTSSPNSTTFSNTISGVGGITKSGTGNATLSGTGNSYQGGTIISAGVLSVTKDSGLGTGNVSLTGGTVQLTLSGGATNDYINDSASISMVTGAMTNLNYLGTDIVSGISLGGVVQATPGTYGSAASGATFTSSFFTGTGTLTLVPEPSTWALFGVGAALFGSRVLRRRRAS